MTRESATAEVDRPRPLAIVTGASSGIGRALAERLAVRGYDLALVARREERLQEVAAELEQAHGVACLVIAADLARPDERERVIDRLAPMQARVEVLVNNAGFGTLGLFGDSALDRDLELVDVNCAAVVHLTRRILPWLLARRRGFILNVSSLAAFTPGPLMALYYASKAFVTSFSEALWEECRSHGVSVTALCPGPVRTEFQDVAGFARGTRGGTPSMPVDTVAEAALAGLFAGRRVVIPGVASRLAALLVRFAPRRWTLRAVRRIQERRRREGTTDRPGSE
jgi:short-subunit dehydrogenase